MRILFAVIILILTLILTGGAHANCFWNLSGRLEGYQPATPISPDRTWPLENVEMRVQVRWASGGWWKVRLDGEDDDSEPHSARACKLTVLVAAPTQEPVEREVEAPSIPLPAPKRSRRS